MVISSSLQLNLGIYTSDKKSEFSLLVDRATGGGSIRDGQLELMLHRFHFLVFYSTLLVLTFALVLIECADRIHHLMKAFKR